MGSSWVIRYLSLWGTKAKWASESFPAKIPSQVPRLFILFKVPDEHFKELFWHHLSMLMLVSYIVGSHLRSPLWSGVNIFCHQLIIKQYVPCHWGFWWSQQYGTFYNVSFGKQWKMVFDLRNELEMSHYIYLGQFINKKHTDPNF